MVVRVRGSRRRVLALELLMLAAHTRQIMLLSESRGQPQALSPSPSQTIRPGLGARTGPGRSRRPPTSMGRTGGAAGAHRDRRDPTVTVTRGLE